MKVLAAVIAGIVKVLLEWAVSNWKKTAQDSNPDSKLKAKLTKAVKDARTKVIILLIVLTVTGCATRTIYVSDGDPVRLRQDVKNVKIWVYDLNGEPVASIITLPEGWYCLPVPEDK